jgi:hypothetical protein
MIIALLLVAYLTFTQLKTKPLPAALSNPETGVSGTLTELPKQVKDKVQAAIDQGEAQRKAAEEALK